MHEDVRNEKIVAIAWKHAAQYKSYEEIKL